MREDGDRETKRERDSYEERDRGTKRNRDEKFSKTNREPKRESDRDR